MTYNSGDMPKSNLNVVQRYRKTTVRVIGVVLYYVIGDTLRDDLRIKYNTKEICDNAMK